MTDLLEVGSVSAVKTLVIGGSVGAPEFTDNPVNPREISVHGFRPRAGGLQNKCLKKEIKNVSCTMI